MLCIYNDFDWSLIAWVGYITVPIKCLTCKITVSWSCAYISPLAHLQGTAERIHVKPQSTQLEYAETAVDHNGTNNTEYAVVAHSNTSAKGHLAQGPSRQVNTTCATGPGNSPLEYATVQDALHVTENIPRSHPSLTNIPSLPLSSPPAPPCSPPGVGISPDCVQDAGYASLPDSRNGSNRITKVRSIRQKWDTSMQVYGANTN